MAIKQLKLGKGNVEWRIITEDEKYYLTCFREDVVTSRIEVRSDLAQKIDGCILDAVTAIHYDLRDLSPTIIERKAVIKGDKKYPPEKNLDIVVISLSGVEKDQILNYFDNRFCLVLDIVATADAVDMVVAFPSEKSYMSITFVNKDKLERYKIYKTRVGTIKHSQQTFSVSEVESDEELRKRVYITTKDMFEGNYTRIQKTYKPRLPGSKIYVRTQEDFDKLSSLNNISGISIKKLSIELVDLETVEVDGGRVTVYIDKIKPEATDLLYTKSLKSRGAMNVNFLNNEYNIIYK